MPGKKLTFALLLVLLPLALGFSSAEETHRSALTDILAKTVNFIILFGGLGFLLAKPLRKFLEEAGLAVEKTIQKIRRARKDAEQKLEALKERMQGLESEARKIREDGREAGKEDKNRLLAQARQEVDRIKSMAEMEIKMHAQAAQDELREYAAELAVSLAKTNIKRRMTPELHARLIDNSIRQLDSLYEKAHSG
ncbi:MAG TPA: ATP synthase F0 subunit B [Candidatus Desulfaltia sp.]|nr:ATP synthase F0 subunit B [Candidatus Desulfaltia sp.]